MAVTIACPKCRAVMRSVNPIPAGRQVKCPKCAASFPAPSESANPVTPGKPSAAGTHKVQPSKPSAAGTHKVQPSKPSAAGISKPDRGSDRPPRRKASKLKLVFALVLVLLVVGSGVFVYSQLAGTSPDSPTATASQASASQPATSAAASPIEPKITDDPLCYLPADSSVIAGADPATIWSLPVMKDAGGLLLKSPAGAWLAELKRLTGLGVEELERFVIAGTGDPTADRPESLVIVARCKGPLEAQKLAQLPDVVATQKGGRRTYHTLKSSALTQEFEVRACCAPVDRLVVVAMGPADRVEAVMDAAGTSSALPAGLMPLLRKVEKTQAWAVLPFGTELRKQLEAALPGLQAMAPPDLQDSARTLAQIRAAAIWLGVDAKEVRLSAGILCPNEAVARDLAGGLGVAWTKAKLPLQKQLEPATKELTADLRVLVEDLFKTGVVAADGSVAHAGIRLNMAPLEGLAKIVNAVGPGVLLASLDTAFQKGTQPPPPPVDHEKDLLALVNKVREAEKLPPLKVDKKLTAAAVQQAKAAAKLANFNTIDLEDVIKHVQAAGYDYVGLTANFGQAPEKDKYDAAILMEKWLADVGPKNNILSKEYSEVGIGFAPGEDNELCIVMIFASPLKGQ